MSEGAVWPQGNLGGPAGTAGWDEDAGTSDAERCGVFVVYFILGRCCFPSGGAGPRSRRGGCHPAAWPLVGRGLWGAHGLSRSSAQPWPSHGTWDLPRPLE